MPPQRPSTAPNDLYYRDRILIRNGQRVTTNDGFLKPVCDRSNLTLIGNALVDRFLFDGIRAIGVRAIANGEIQEFRGRDIVLCAGAIYSPGIWKC